MWQWFGIGGAIGIFAGIIIGMFLMFAWQRKLGLLRYCSDDRVDGPCVGDTTYGSDDDFKKSGVEVTGYKKSASNVENGVANGDVLHCYDKGRNDPVKPLANGKLESVHCSSKEKNNFNVTSPPYCPPNHDPTKLNYGVKYDQSVSLHQRRTSQPAQLLKMNESPQRVRSNSVVNPTRTGVTMVPVAITSESVSNRAMAHYGSNYSLDPTSAKPTLTPTNKVRYDANRDSIDFDQSLQKSTDC